MTRYGTILAGALAVTLLCGGAFAQPPREQGQRGGGGEVRGQRQELGAPRKPDGRGPGDGRGPDEGRSRNPVVLALDTDGDGEFSADEIANAAAALRKLDKDGDGRLSREEMRPEASREGEYAGRGEGGLRPKSKPADRPASGDRRKPPRPGDQKGPPSGPPRRPGDGSEPPAERKWPAPDNSDDRRASQSPTSGARTPIVRSAVQGPFPGFVSIPAGEFEMGDHHGFVDPKHGSDETPIHRVRLSAFAMAICDVTTQQYSEFLNGALAQRSIEVRDGGVYLAEGSELLAETREMSPHSRIGWDGRAFSVLDGKENHPIVCIRWEGAAVYCNWLSARHGLAPCYDTATWACDLSKTGFRLPTEAEWEYAARGGLHDPYSNFPWGDEPDTARANWPESKNPFQAGPLPHTTPVGFFNGQLQRKADFNWPGPQETYQTSDGANGYGLYDMAGNVWQFCNDWYASDYYASSPLENPPGPAKGKLMPDGEPYRCMRGGNWYNGEWGHSRVSNRNPSYWRGPQDPDHPYYHVGFRVVLAGDLPAAAGDQMVAANNVGVSLRETEIHLAERDAYDARTVGLMLDADQACPGYTLFAPKHHTMTYLLDNQGRAVHRWDSQYEPGQSVYLLENGHLLHCCFTRNKGFTRGGEGGRLEEFDWEGNQVWEFEYSSDQYLSHHDVKPLPNGNILVLAVEKKSLDECLAAGFDPQMLRDQQLFPEHFIEVQPTRPKGGKIVWQWHVWDHLIQDNDSTKANYGNIAEHPELIDVDCNGRATPAFWNHGNSIAYNAQLDQIVLSARGCNEIWVIDHSTTTAEAAGHRGGRSGKGGDLLYRWGNPVAYGRGTAEDRQLFQQHDAQWIPEGSPGAGHILIFNNGLDRGFSTVEEIVPPVDSRGNYTIAPGKAFGPDKPVWRYQAKNPTDFFSSEISGAHRLPNGNTLICAGVRGTFFEVTPAGETVWRYVNPVVHNGILAQGEKSGLDHRGHNWNAVFKIHRYPIDYPGLAGKDLTPLGPIEQPASLAGKTGFADQPPEGEPVRGGGGREGDRRGEGKGRPKPPPREDNQ
ncbi:MAG TPA: SUMF1/EgtB/PvdO family nonheme iron enzyme [Candidatus Anammoximicrobium sp.]|nr:SUMF1/EgtB/PvdO family nonheme iron enzyme [Candidatus Anammoximicrobium sp.]